MDTNNSYKRTVAGSVGAGMGALFNGSGRTYYILEHKTDASPFHHVGDTQKIIIDQIELGRGGSCQVRYPDEKQFETVSRKHAAIVRDGLNWKLIHLSESNPTLVNGQVVNGSQVLQSGDEIQLAVNGPRLGFIVPPGKQALTSSIRLTERMNLFRKQALAPYKRAIWTLALLLLLAIIGLGTWNYLQHQEIKEQEKQLMTLLEENRKLDSDIQLLEEKMKNNPNDDELKSQLEELKNRKQEVVTRYQTIYRIIPNPSPLIKPLEDNIDGDKDDDDDKSGSDMENTTRKDDVDKSIAEDTSSDKVTSDGASDDIADYANDVYIIKIDRIQVEYDGVAADPGIATAYVTVGTGFMANGAFVTARSNIQPWLKIKGLKESWREELSLLKALGFDIRVWFSAYSAKGTTNRIQFSTDQININALGAYDDTEGVSFTKDFVKKINSLGYNFKWKDVKSKTFKRPVFASNSHSAVKVKIGSGGIPSDIKKGANLKGGEEVQIAGYHGISQHGISGNFEFTTSNTKTASGSYVTLQGAPGNDRGHLGSPAFYKGEDGRYRVIGVYVGSPYGEARLVPLSRIN